MKLFFGISVKFTEIFIIQICVKPGHPWWSTGKESTCQRRGLRFGHCSGKIQHAVGHLSLWPTTAEAPMLRAQSSPSTEGTALRSQGEEQLLLVATKDSPPTATNTQHSQKLINFKNSKQMIKICNMLLNSFLVTDFLFSLLHLIFIHSSIFFIFWLQV